MPVRYNSPPIVTNGLIAAYDPRNPKSYVSGSTTIRDLTFNLPMYIVGSFFYSGNYGGGFSFSSSTTGNLSSNPSSPNLLTSAGCTVEIWVQHNSFKTSGTTYMRYVSLINVSPDADDIILRHAYNGSTLTNGGIEAIVFTSGTARILAINNILTIGVPTHLVMTWNGTTLLVYKNGTQIGTLTPGGTYSPTSTKAIGISSNSTECMDGQIYSTLVYNRPLTASEVTQNFNLTRTRFGI